MKFAHNRFRLLAASILLIPLAFSPVGIAAASDQEGIDISVAIPETSTSNLEFEVSDAQFRWGLNKESTSGAFAPGTCNFLSAGVVGDAKSSREWSKADKFYAQKSGQVRIEKPHAAGTWVDDSWENKCLDKDGRRVGTSVSEPGTGAQIVIDGGTGTIHTGKGTASIKWKGSFTSAMYGGMIYWSATDPELSIADGTGTLTATLSGYGSDRDDMTKWSQIKPQKVTLATLPSVTLGQAGIITDPSYKRVKVENTESPQVRTGTSWGAFPQSFVDFQAKTGQAAYWYSTGGARDTAKVASTLYISYTPANSVLPSPPTDEVASGADDNSREDSKMPTVLPQRDTPEPSGPVPGTGSVIGSAPIPGGSILGGSVMQSPPMGTVLAAASTAAVGAASWLGNSLIPDAMELARDYKNWLLWAIAGFLGLTSLSWIGFRRGWLALPFKFQKSQSK